MAINKPVFIAVCLVLALGIGFMLLTSPAPAPASVVQPVNNTPAAPSQTATDNTIPDVPVAVVPPVVNEPTPETPVTETPTVVPPVVEPVPVPVIPVPVAVVPPVVEVIGNSSVVGNATGNYPYYHSPPWGWDGNATGWYINETTGLWVNGSLNATVPPVANDMIPAPGSAWFWNGTEWIPKDWLDPTVPHDQPPQDGSVPVEAYVPPENGTPPIDPATIHYEPSNDTVTVGVNETVPVGPNETGLDKDFWSNWPAWDTVTA